MYDLFYKYIAIGTYAKGTSVITVARAFNIRRTAVNADSHAHVAPVSVVAEVVAVVKITAVVEVAAVTKTTAVAKATAVEAAETTSSSYFYNIARIAAFDKWLRIYSI
jgi:hypothetical protein